MIETKKLFGTSGVRGLFGQKITVELISKISISLYSMYPNEGIIVGYDTRYTSEALAEVASAILSLSGAQVYLVEMCSFPVIANLTRDSKHHLAIYITASHNPPEYSGVKVLFYGRELTEEEQEKLEQKILVNKDGTIKYAKWNEIHPQIALNHKDLLYIERIKEFFTFDKNKRTLIVDCANGTMSSITPKILTQFGFRVITLNSFTEGSSPGRLTEPSEENLGTLKNICKQEKAIGIAHDGDGDRVSLIDENGSFIELSRINALLVKIILDEKKEGKIVLSIDSSKVIDTVVMLYNQNVERTSLGSVHSKIIDLIHHDKHVIFGAEPWKPIFPEWGLWIDGLYGALKILEKLCEEKIELHELMNTIPNSISVRESFLVSSTDIQEIYDKCLTIIETYFENEKKIISRYDGIRYDLINGTWFLIRKSGTEPKIRLYYESASEEHLNSLKELIKELHFIIKGVE